MIIDHNTALNIVEAWQLFLKNQGIVIGIADGLWGPHTANATKQFQIKNNLIADGKIGQETIKVAQSKGFELPKAEEFNPPGYLNAICDISHLNENVDLTKAKAAGMLAVIHKATQSVGNTLFHDHMYPIRRQMAKEEGLLWGAYHFGTGGDGITQANEFLSYTLPDNDTLLILDFERSTTKLRNGMTEPTMKLQEAQDFVNQIHLKTGKYPGIYGGALLKEELNTAADLILSKCWLWIAEYATTPKLPLGWSNDTIWQFTDGKNGPGALPINGIGLCDRDLFKGNESELIKFWKNNQV